MTETLFNLLKELLKIVNTEPQIFLHCSQFILVRPIAFKQSPLFNGRQSTVG
ncbi:MAG: hypothetical protein LH647_12075 [Leptolyngbyaceae cyanobacterium CAN_BIN12]|nr:hypothetical protein [Leptolyngbyaceae cyanobacterium CAN_BIN12]